MRPNLSVGQYGDALLAPHSVIAPLETDILFVVVGASMGGQHILRLLRKPGWPVADALFSGFGNDHDLKWQNFWSIAEGTVQAPEYPVSPP